MPCFDLRRSQLMLRCSTKRTDARQLRASCRPRPAVSSGSKRLLIFVAMRVGAWLR